MGDLTVVAGGAGRIDGFWEFGTDGFNWLAGALIAREAGARVTSARGEPFTGTATSLLATAPALHEPLRALLAAVQ